MADVIFVLLILGLFALAGLLVIGCDQIIGPAVEARDDTRHREPSTAEGVAV